MSSHFEVVRTDAEQPWHARFVAADGRIVWTTEQYGRRGEAEQAVVLITGSTIWVGNEESGGFRYVTYGSVQTPMEVRLVDERTGTTS